MSAEPIESSKYKGVWLWKECWWFEDETNNFVGPYESDDEADKQFKHYCEECL